MQPILDKKQDGETLFGDIISNNISSNSIVHNSYEAPFKSRFKTWLRVVAFVVVAVFLPEQVSWAFNYNPLVLWNKKDTQNKTVLLDEQTASPEEITAVKLSSSIQNLLNKIAYQDNARIQLSLTDQPAVQGEPEKSILIESKINFTDKEIDQVVSWLRDPKIHPLNCGVYALKDFLSFKGISVSLEEASVSTLAVDLLSNIVKPGEEKLKTSLYAIEKVAKGYGLNVKSAKIPATDLVLLKTPFIANFGSEHFVVVKSIEPQQIRLVDLGKEQSLTREEFARQFSGFVLALDLEKQPELSYENVTDAMKAFVWGNEWVDRSDEILIGMMSTGQMLMGLGMIIVQAVISYFTGGAGYAGMAWVGFSAGVSALSSKIAEVCVLKWGCSAEQAFILNVALSVALTWGGSAAASGIGEVAAQSIAANEAAALTGGVAGEAAFDAAFNASLDASVSTINAVMNGTMNATTKTILERTLLGAGIGAIAGAALGCGIGAATGEGCGEFALYGAGVGALAGGLAGYGVFGTDVTNALQKVLDWFKGAIDKVQTAFSGGTKAATETAKTSAYNVTRDSILKSSGWSAFGKSLGEFAKGLTFGALKAWVQWNVTQWLSDVLFGGEDKDPSKKDKNAIFKKAILGVMSSVAAEFAGTLFASGMDAIWGGFNFRGSAGLLRENDSRAKGITTKTQAFWTNMKIISISALNRFVSTGFSVLFRYMAQELSPKTFSSESMASQLLGELGSKIGNMVFMIVYNSIEGKSALGDQQKDIAKREVKTDETGTYYEEEVSLGNGAKSDKPVRVYVPEGTYEKDGAIQYYVDNNGEKQYLTQADSEKADKNLQNLQAEAEKKDKDKNQVVRTFPVEIDVGKELTRILFSSVLKIGLAALMFPSLHLADDKVKRTGHELEDAFLQGLAMWGISTLVDATVVSLMSRTDLAQKSAGSSRILQYQLPRMSKITKTTLLSLIRYLKHFLLC